MNSQQDEPQRKRRPITIAIADNDVITLQALAALLEDTDGFHVTWTAGSCRQALANCLTDERWPNVLLIDAELGDASGVELCRRLREANGVTAMLVITAYPPEHYRNEAALAGAQGILGKADYPWLAKAIRIVGEGRTFAVPSGSGGQGGTSENASPPPFEPAHAAHRRLLEEGRARAQARDHARRHVPRHPAGSLSYQESQILDLSSQGFTQAEIADRLGITSASVRTHSSRARRKLGARTLVQAVVGWLSGGGQNRTDWANSSTGPEGASGPEDASGPASEA